MRTLDLANSIQVSEIGGTVGFAMERCLLVKPRTPHLFKLRHFDAVMLTKAWDQYDADMLVSPCYKDLFLYPEYNCHIVYKTLN